MYIPCSNRLVTWGGGCCRLRSYLRVVHLVCSAGRILKQELQDGKTKTISFAHLHNLLLEGFLSCFHHHSHHERSGKSSNSIRSPGNDAEKDRTLKIMNTIYLGLTMSSLLTVMFPF